MNHGDRNNPERSGIQNPEPPDEVLEALFQHAQSRVRPAAEVEQEVRTALHAQWRQMTRKRSQRIRGFAMAASVLLAVTVAYFVSRTDPVPDFQELAVVDRQEGPVYVLTGRSPEVTVPALDNRTLVSGQEIRTAVGSTLALRWNSGESLRLDQNTHVHLTGPQRVELLEGRVYVDTNRDAPAPGPQLSIATKAGIAHHIGTQYLAGYSGGQMIVVVRDGKVNVMNSGAEISAVAGEQLIVGSDGRTQLSEVPVYGPEWQWAESAAPAYDINGKTAWEFIQWVAYETGRQVQFDSVEAEAMARATILRGGVNFDPTSALDLILPTSDLQHMTGGSDIVISIRNWPE